MTRGEVCSARFSVPGGQRHLAALVALPQERTSHRRSGMTRGEVRSARFSVPGACGISLRWWHCRRSGRHTEGAV